MFTTRTFETHFQLSVPRKMRFFAITLLCFFGSQIQYLNCEKVSGNPCTTILCGPNTKCWWDPSTGERKGCENRCTKKSCPPGYLCTTVDKCPDQSCRPTINCTRRPDPCASHRCQPNEFCWYDSGFQPHCTNPCIGIECKAGYQCVGGVGECGTTACPPQDRCSSPCEYVRCSENKLCYSNTKGRKPKCVDACLSSPRPKCKAGFKCRTQQGSCNDYSCPPVPHCYNPCEDVTCEEPNTVCWFDGNRTICENACARSECFPTFNCTTVPDTDVCDDGTCPPTVECYRKYPPTSCDGIDCGCKGKCTLVNTLQYPVVPICGPDPCIDPPKPCCSLRTNNGLANCTADGCYLKFVDGTCRTEGEACKVRQVCRDPCRVGKVRCPPGTFCYKDRVECFVAPCNPIAECRQPCESSSVCDPDQTCEVIKVSCAANAPYCKPLEICVPKTSKKNN